MPRYVPEDSLQSPRFTGPSTFARLPDVRTLDEVDLAVVGVPGSSGRPYKPPSSSRRSTRVARARVRVAADATHRT
jgi:agmatinase